MILILLRLKVQFEIHCCLMSFAQHLKNILRFNLYLFIITLRHNNKIQEQGESQKISLNLKLDFLDLNNLKIKIQDSRHLRFNLRFEFETLLFDSPATDIICINKTYAGTYNVCTIVCTLSLCNFQMPMTFWYLLRGKSEITSKLLKKEYI